MWPSNFLALTFVCFLAALAPACSQYVGSTAYVSPNGPVRFRQAFQNNTITNIVLTGDYSIGKELDDTKAIPITR